MTTRVAYVCADPGIPVFGTKGASVHVQEIIRAWRAKGAEVHVYAVRLGDEVPADLADLPVHIVKVGGKGLDPAEREVAQQRAAAELARQVAELAPDVVYERYSLFSTVLEHARLALGSAVTTVLEVNAPLIDEQRTHRVLVDEQSAVGALGAQLAAADVVACVSQPVADWVREHARPGSVIPPVVVVPNGVNTERVLPVTPDLDGPPVVVFVGTLKPWHGVEDLVRAAALARVPWRLRIVGDGPQRETVERLAAEHDLDVELVGAVPPEQVPATLQGALVAVAPYPATAAADHYFSPLKVYEYGAAALPVVASRIGEIPRVVEHGRTGTLVPPSDPAALAAAIDELVADPARALRFGAAARESMVRSHSWHQVLATTLEPVDGYASRRG